VTAERDLGGRSEPAKLEIRFLLAGRGDGEGGLGEVVLHRDRLERLVREPGVQGHDRGGIAGERPVGERVDLD
jgi:hypothetical protein